MEYSGNLKQETRTSRLDIEKQTRYPVNPIDNVSKPIEPQYKAL